MIHRTTSCGGLKTKVPKSVAQQYVAQHPPVMSVRFRAATSMGRRLVRAELWDHTVRAQIHAQEQRSPPRASGLVDRVGLALP
jgi:hypothetical protein